MEFMDSKKLAVKYDFKPSYIRYLVQTKQIPFVKINRLVRFNIKEIERWVSQKIVKPVDISKVLS